MKVVWNLSVTISYSDNSWESSELVKDDDGFRSFGPDISKLPEIKSLLTNIGFTAIGGTYYRNDVTDVTYRFSALTANGNINVSGGVENFYQSNNAEAVKTALSLDSDFTNTFVLGLDINAVLSSLNTNYQSILNAIDNRHVFPDRSFSESYGVIGNTSPGGHVSYAMRDADGKLLVVFETRNYDGPNRSYIVRLNSDMSLDDAFNVIQLDPPEQFISAVNGICQFSNKKYLVYGTNIYARYSNSGIQEALDDTLTIYDYLYEIEFPEPGQPYVMHTMHASRPTGAKKAIVLSDDTVLVLTSRVYSLYNGDPGFGSFRQATVVRCNINGKLLPTFNFWAYGKVAVDGNWGTNSNNCYHEALDFSPSEDGNSFFVISNTTYLGGGEIIQGLTVRKINIDGTLNLSFGYDFNEQGWQFEQNRLFTPSKLVVVKPLDDYLVQPLFAFPRLLAQGDDKLIVYNLKSIQLTSVTDPFIDTERIIRYNADGTLDNSFNIPHLMFTQSSEAYTPKPFVSSIINDNDGIIVCGRFYSLDQDQYESGIFVGSIRKNVVRLKVDGSVDDDYLYPDYNYDPNVGGTFTMLKINDSKIVLGINEVGSTNGIRNSDDSQYYDLVTLDHNGTIDNTKSLKAPLPLGVSNCRGIGDSGYDSFLINLIWTNNTASYEMVSNYGYYDYPYDSVPKTHTPHYFDQPYTDDLRNINGYAEPYVTENITDALFLKDGQIRSGQPYFGEGSTYFTNMYPGLFVLMAKDVNIEEYYSVGELANSIVSAVSHFDIQNKYTCILKTNQNYPLSVNQLFLIPGGIAGLAYDMIPDNGTDDTRIAGLSDRDHLIQLTVVTTNSNNDVMSQQNASEVATAFLQSAGLI